MNEEILFKKEIMFHVDNEEELPLKQLKVLQGLEVLGFRYEIKRTSQYGTNTPTWVVTVFKR